MVEQNKKKTAIDIEYHQISHKRSRRFSLECQEHMNYAFVFNLERAASAL